MTKLEARLAARAQVPTVKAAMKLLHLETIPVEQSYDFVVITMSPEEAIAFAAAVTGKCVPPDR